MDEQFVKLLFFLIIVIGSIVKSVSDAKKKKEQEERRQGRRRSEPLEPEAMAPKEAGKSLAEWIEEVRRSAAAEAAPTPAPTVAPAPEEEVVHHVRHEAPKTTTRAPHETIKAHRETEHVFHEAVRPSVVIDEEEPERPRKRPRKAATETQKARVAPRQFAEREEDPAVVDDRARKARRAERARRVGRGSGDREAAAGGQGLGLRGLAGRDLKRAFILKELLDEPLSIRRRESPR